MMLAVADQAWSMTPRGALGLDDIPPENAPWEQIIEFVHTFNGYAHFGKTWGEQCNAVRERYFGTDELPDDVDDLRACLFCEFRMDRFSWGDDVSLSEPDAEGVRHIINKPGLCQKTNRNSGAPAIERPSVEGDTSGARRPSQYVVGHELVCS